MTLEAREGGIRRCVRGLCCGPVVVRGLDLEWRG
jgi:hypothetical protein